ncbi:interferon a3-like [Sphaeramia orbicularis]|uniref:Interferon a3-like n=1 Tax=Sphaeramia orbicularis TaxID=375764 RepID=A0A673ADP1_9TELE|nr:interferon a3-like [Sphaeramia orbicularis]
MPNKIFFVCLFVSLFCAGASLSCRWMGKFRQYNEKSLTLLEGMVTNSTNSTVDAAEEDAVAFPDELYKHASKASAEDRLAFTVQILEEVAALFEEDRSPSNETVWEETTVENFINLTTQQADGLRSCIVSHSHKKKNKKLSLYFKRLSHHAKQMVHSADAWELIRKEAHAHLLRADILVTSVLTPLKDQGVEPALHCLQNRANLSLQSTTLST